MFPELLVQFRQPNRQEGKTFGTSANFSIKQRRKRQENTRICQSLFAVLFLESSWRCSVAKKYFGMCVCFPVLSLRYFVYVSQINPFVHPTFSTWTSRKRSRIKLLPYRFMRIRHRMTDVRHLTQSKGGQGIAREGTVGVGFYSKFPEHTERER